MTDTLSDEFLFLHSKSAEVNKSVSGLTVDETANINEISTTIERLGVDIASSTKEADCVRAKVATEIVAEKNELSAEILLKSHNSSVGHNIFPAYLHDNCATNDVELMNVKCDTSQTKNPVQMTSDLFQTLMGFAKIKEPLVEALAKIAATGQKTSRSGESSVDPGQLENATCLTQKNLEEHSYSSTLVPQAPIRTGQEKLGSEVRAKASAYLAEAADEWIRIVVESLLCNDKEQPSCISKLCRGGSFAGDSKEDLRMLRCRMMTAKQPWSAAIVVVKQ
eukprot:TRINITY_DN54985_c0_g1_i1.p1 TRINITY_DN54985_c0_g1~~TRINITY_DN54985_c0_g1_i1.p1  ORF type:complete len:296 (-),score=43.28 TRINITY_DN54985_c0_g1_i1:57-893(-)